MLGPKILPAVLIALPATILLMAQPSLGESPGDACKASPGASAPQGLHWYYRVDRTNKQHCWYLDAEGKHVRSLENVASPASSQHENAGEKVEAKPNDTVHTAAAQPATARAADIEASLREPSVDEHTAIDFAARWLELPKSLDLDVRDFAPLSNGYAGEHGATNAQEQPSFTIRSEDNELRQSSKAKSNFGSILLASVLGIVLLLLCREAFKLAGMLYLEAKRRRARADFPEAKGSGSVVGARHNNWRNNAVWPAPRSANSAGNAEISLGELMRALRRVDAVPYAPRSFASSGAQTTKSPKDRRNSQSNHLGRRAHSAFNVSSRNRAMA
jgi:hypothetical protein